MLRKAIIEEILQEREYQIDRWGGHSRDRIHTVNDWIAFISGYVGRAWTDPFDRNIYRKSLIKVAALALAAIETLDMEVEG